MRAEASGNLRPRDGIEKNVEMFKRDGEIAEEERKWGIKTVRKMRDHRNGYKRKRVGVGD